jgi:heme/copper-type cytochrome/quinol oxidase subunit 1
MQMENVQSSPVKRLLDPLYRAKGWIKFAGIMSIIYGIFNALSVIGIIIAWLPIWMGIVLVSASKLIQQAYDNDREQDMVTSLDKLGTYFKIFGVVMIVALVIAVIGILAAIMIPAYVGMQQKAFMGGM